MNKQARALRMKDEYKKAVMYQLFLRAFHRDGTLRAAADMLDSLAELGIDIVYLSPIAEADGDTREEFWSDRQRESGLQNPKNPYRIKDYFKIDEEYGTEEDLTAFVKKAHRLGMKVLLDLVYYHCGPCAVFLEDHPEFVRRLENGGIEYGEYHFPKLNYACGELREYLYANMLYFVERFDVDGYRCDVGSSCPLDFWEEGRRRLEAVKSDLFMLNEGAKGEYLTEAFEADYGWDWSEALYKVLKKEAAAGELRAVYEKKEAVYPAGFRSLLFVDTHDYANDAKDCRFETAFGSEAADAALFLNMMMSGLPFLYNGCEVGDTRRHSIYYNRFFPGDMTVDWAKGFTRPGRARFQFLKRMIDLRHRLRPLWEGDLTWIPSDSEESVVSFCRAAGGQRVLAAVNLSDAPLTAHIEAASRDIPSLIEVRHTQVRAGETVTLEMLPYGFVLFAF